MAVAVALAGCWTLAGNLNLVFLSIELLRIAGDRIDYDMVFINDFIIMTTNPMRLFRDHPDFRGRRVDMPVFDSHKIPF